MRQVLNGLVLIALVISSCNSSGQKNTGTANKTGGTPSKFHACNYDGSPYDATNAANMSATEEGEAVVEKILAFTGLPQNFKVQQGEVPNAAAVILQEPDGTLARYILYNKDFMQMVDDRTKNNWAGISILAHEIGHHLSGHTLLAGGSQPAIELEADKFSGYVLYKMGAGLKEAQIAMNTLVPDEDGDTHPGRPKRLQAILDGWNQACKQSKGNCDATGGDAPNPNAPSPNEIVLNNDNPQQSTENMSPQLPSTSKSEIPLKFDRFVYDEANLLTDDQEKEFSDKLKEVASNSGAEVVILCPKSLNGLSINEYAYTIMEKMRIGKMDLANGAVFIMSEGKLGFYVQPGLYWRMGKELTQSTMDDMIKAGQEAEAGDNAYQAFRYGVAGIDVHLNTGVVKWNMDYPNLADAKKDGEKSVGKISRAIGTVTAKSDFFVGDNLTRLNFKTDDGEEIYIHVMNETHGNIPLNKRMAVVGRLYDMKYGVTVEVMSVEMMR